MSVREILSNTNKATITLKDVDITSTDIDKLSVTKEGAGTDTLTFSLTPTSDGQVDSVTITSTDDSKLKVTEGGTDTDPVFELNNLVQPGGKVDGVALTSSGNTVTITQNSGSTAENPSFNLESQGGGGGKVDYVTITSTDDTKLTVTKGGTETHPMFELDNVIKVIHSLDISSSTPKAIEVHNDGSAKEPKYIIESKIKPGGALDDVNLINWSPNTLQCDRRGDSTDAVVNFDLKNLIEPVKLTSLDNTITIAKNADYSEAKPSFDLKTKIEPGGQVDSVTITSEDSANLTVTKGGTAENPTFRIKNLGNLNSLMLGSEDESKLEIKEVGPSTRDPIYLFKNLVEPGGDVDTVTITSANTDKLTVATGGTRTNPSFTLTPLGGGGGGGQVDSVTIKSTDESRLKVRKGGTAEDPTFELSNLVNPGGVDSVTITSSDDTKLKVTEGGTDKDPTFKILSYSGQVDSVTITSSDPAKLKVTASGSDEDPMFTLDNLVKPGGQVDSVTLTSSSGTITINKNAMATAANPSFNLEAVGLSGHGNNVPGVITWADGINTSSYANQYIVFGNMVFLSVTLDIPGFSDNFPTLGRITSNYRFKNNIMYFSGLYVYEDDKKDKVVEPIYLNCYSYDGGIQAMSKLSTKGIVMFSLSWLYEIVWG